MKILTSQTSSKSLSLGVQQKQWDATKEIKKKIEDAETQFNSDIKKHVGSNTQLMMPGNYARMMFNERNEQQRGAPNTTQRNV